jgi:hypothetical protein
MNAYRFVWVAAVLGLPQLRMLGRARLLRPAGLQGRSPVGQLLPGKVVPLRASRQPAAVVACRSFQLVGRVWLRRAGFVRLWRLRMRPQRLYLAGVQRRRDNRAAAPGARRIGHGASTGPSAGASRAADGPPLHFEASPAGLPPPRGASIARGPAKRSPSRLNAGRRSRGQAPLFLPARARYPASRHFHEL